SFPTRRSSDLRNVLKTEFGQLLAKGYLERLLKNPFYKGQFIWEDKLYNGTHAPLISAEVFEQVQSVFRGHNKPKYRSRDFAFSACCGPGKQDRKSTRLNSSH